ncbi:alpha/beta hydrolase family protein [Novosphingobium mangrovi (ex Huang et al. 2023)]|uniref:Prolyl oligopeptidase family serine peptidase n=1 Tax=Novosphingobium mangrovi (ex Huang et al. 2023) TaxID=2976432 RepID=A0ABT2I7E9_9SPHN|nr:alpha/beta fold hydrolase [Novosphingobium mangrovi (ex Huang et al. 2023)]MCT2400718.1 prolyl oligopeptidase family serine peptidase [Novosphingobium mangrovi (ex Huang et al. 2023)]
MSSFVRPVCSALALVVASLAVPSQAKTATDIPLEAYGDLPTVEDIALSPDGTKRASIRNFKGTLRLIVMDDKDNVLANASAGTSKVRSVRWADDSTILVTNTATVSLGPYFAASKYELTGTIIVPLNIDQKPELVFSNRRNIADTTRGAYGIRRIGGRTVGYFGGIALDTGIGGAQFRHGRTTLYAVELPDNRAHQAARAPAEDHYRDWLIDAAGNVAITLDINNTNGKWIIENAQGQELARGVDPTGDMGLICFGQDGATIIYSVRDDDEVDHWYEVPLAGGQATEFLPDIAIERLYIDPASNKLLGYRKNDESGETVMFDPLAQSALKRIFAAFPNRNVRLIDWTEGFRKVVLRTDGNGDSGTWYLVDVTNRRADPIGYERPAIWGENVGPISRVEYTATDGLELDGVLTLPPGHEARNLPIVVLPHGGPRAADEVGFDWWAQAFASRGYAVFQPNFRGSTGRGDALRNASYGEWGRKMQTDISDGLAELVKRGIADPKRACIVGASYGGYAALAGVTLQHGLYRCSVAVAPVADIDMFFDNRMYETGRSHMARNSWREELGDPKHYDEVSPRKHAAEADAPVMLIHGKDDTVVPYRQSVVMADALKDAGKPYELVTLKGEDHWLSRSETRQQMLEAAMVFVQKHNPAD